MSVEDNSSKNSVPQKPFEKYLEDEFIKLAVRLSTLAQSLAICYLAFIHSHYILLALMIPVLIISDMALVLAAEKME